MRVPVEHNNEMVELKVEFVIYREDELDPNQVDILGTTPDVDLTEAQEAQIIEFILENYEPGD